MTKNRKSSASRQKTPSSSSNDTQTTHTKQHVHDTTRAGEHPGPSRPPTWTSHLSLLSLRPSLSVFFASVSQQQRARRSQQRNSVAAQLPLLTAPRCVVFVFLFHTRHESLVIFEVLLSDTHHLDEMLSDAQLGGGTARSDTPEMMEFLFFPVLFQILPMFALPVQPALQVSTPWTGWESLSCPLGADRSHSRPPTRAFVVSFVCVMDWPGYFAAQTSPRGRETGPRVPATPANGKPRCLQALVGKIGHEARCCVW